MATLAHKFQYLGQGFVRSPGATDAVWLSLDSATLPNVDLLYVGLSL